MIFATLAMAVGVCEPAPCKLEGVPADFEAELATKGLDELLAPPK